MKSTREAITHELNHVFLVRSKERGKCMRDPGNQSLILSTIVAIIHTFHAGVFHNQMMDVPGRHVHTDNVYHHFP